MFLQAETLLYHDLTFGFSQDGLSEDFSAKSLLPERNSQSRGLSGTCCVGLTVDRSIRP